jgi:uncharacterized protein (TIGR02186 family)
MTSLRALLALAAVALMASLGPARSQAQEGNPEKIEIGLSTDMIAITADFSGADLTIFGALDNADPLINRQGRYDVIVVLEGPARPVVVRRKDRVLGIWMNTLSETFINVPVSYSVATTRQMQDITDSNNYRQLSLGAENIYIEPLDRAQKPETLAEFTRCATARRLRVSTANASAACSSCRRTCSARRCRLRRTSRSARTRRAPSCSATASSSWKPRRRW